MKRVYKYQVPVNDRLAVIHMHKGARILHVSDNGDISNVYFWAEIDTSAEAMEPRFFQLFGTGHAIPDTAKWIGTTTTSSLLVWHLYEVLAQ
jgi:hypothetical protein